MNLNIFDRYLLIINIIALVIYGIKVLVYKHQTRDWFEKLCMFIVLLGGSAGILLMIILFDRKAVKENMMSRVFTLCMLVIQAILLLIVKGYHGDQIHIDFWDYLMQHRILLIYLAVVNILTIIVFGVDKMNAKSNRQRVRIVTLLGLAFIGGSVGALIGMYGFRHKTKKAYFTVGVPLILLMQVVVLFYVMNMGIFFGEVS
ncbi:DUF1294 domain-containing protein [Coprococcus sp. B2-R-112]|uniref:DUF1294 domain-containing protein n=1 Tax=Coprococcus sp. B2-R-112 TaxID=2949662 RepID=UPI002030F15C|nr:DUF1294 domain-containing protein [Coprococcus sp. B2-R-112]MCM0663043.1 DUF1294 domain-containing protein [Coprococcus sp. B2-R-112]